MQQSSSPCHETSTGPASGSGLMARIDEGLERGAGVTIYLDGLPIQAYEGESVAAALLASGVRTFRITGRREEPRGPYCGMGVCFECVMEVDGRPNVRTCRLPVRDGMRLATQRGAGTWTLEPPAP